MNDIPVSLQGLSASAASDRLSTDGPNALPGGQRRTLLSIALETVREPMFMLLLAAGAMYLAFGDLQEGLTLFGFVVTLGLTPYQAGKTERVNEAHAFGFATLVVANLALILSNCSVTKPIWVTLRTPNLTLRIVVSLALALLLGALYLPWALSLLRFAPLPPHELAVAAPLGLVSVLWSEGIKQARRMAGDVSEKKGTSNVRRLR